MSIPKGFAGPVTLVVSRAVEPEDAPWSRGFDFSNELAPTGLFYCLNLTSMPPASAGAVLEGLGYQVRWYYSTSTGNAEGLAGHDDTVDAPPPGSRVYGAELETPGIVDVGLAADADVPGLRQNDGTPDTSEPPVPSWAPDCGSDWAPFTPTAP